MSIMPGVFFPTLYLQHGPSLSTVFGFPEVCILQMASLAKTLCHFAARKVVEKGQPLWN